MADDGTKRGTTRTLRLIEAGGRIADTPPKSKDVEFQHSVLCQCSLPHRPTTARKWEREQGHVSLRIEAGSVKRDQQWVEVPLPHGEKPRLLLMHLNTEAVRSGSPVVDVERSMTAFVREIGIDQNGPSIRGFKDQMTRVAAATVRFAVGDERHTVQRQMHVVEEFELWWPKDERRRVMWPTEIRLSDQYFRGLQGHAVPLDHRALRWLKRSSLALDVYCWLAQRLHRIEPGKRQEISWAALKEQFGADYARERAFREKFTPALRTVRTFYQRARVEETEGGLVLFESPPARAEGAVKAAGGRPEGGTPPHGTQVFDLAEVIHVKLVAPST